MSETVIRIDNVSKSYRLGTIGGRTLSAELQSKWARLRGKEDPNTLIGTGASSVGSSFYALKDIRLEVKKGEALGVIGANGAGKSTLLKLLSRVTAPTEGTISIKGRIASMLEVGTGFHPELTGRENIYLNGSILGMTRDEIDGKIDDIIEFSECAQFIDTPVKRYSSGMYVKLAFAVAAHLDADIMIMDEVLAVGDAKFQQKCLGTMSDATGEAGRTVLYVSHNMNTIRQLCTRCVVLDHGRIIHDGDVEDAISIYMGTNNQSLETHYDLEDVSRPSPDHGLMVRIMSLDFVNGKQGCFNNSEPVRFKLRWRSSINAEGLRCRLSVDNMDSTPVGLAESAIIGDARIDCENECILEWPIDNLVGGDYLLSIDLYVNNEYGTRQSYDHPGVKFRIRVEDMIAGSDKSIMWDRKSWNSVRLNTITPV